MKKYLFPIIGLILILLVISAGCIKPPESSHTSQSQDTSNSAKPSGTAIIKSDFNTDTTANSNFINNSINLQPPKYSVGQIALKAASGTKGLAIVDYNSITYQYGTLPVVHDKKGTGWHSNGYEITIWRDVSEIEKDYKYVDSIVLDPLRISLSDVTNNELFDPSSKCDLAGDWKIKKSDSVYKFRLDNVVVNQTGDQILIGSWDSVKSKDERTFIIRWNYGPTPESANYAEKITISIDYSEFDGIDNYNREFDGEWIGLVPTWKKEMDKTLVDDKTISAMESYCRQWYGGGDWYNHLV